MKPGASQTAGGVVSQFEPGHFCLAQAFRPGLTGNNFPAAPFTGLVLREVEGAPVVLPVNAP